MVRSCRRHRADGWPRARSVRSPDGPVKRAGAVPGDAAPPADRPCWLSFPPMTDRGLPIVDGAPACPFVAFEDDRDGRGQAPDHRHRCFAEPRPAPRALAHQEAYCLSSAFPVCPTFQDWARREAATARAAQLDIRAAGPRGAGQPVAAAAGARGASRAEHRHPAAPAAAPQSAARLGGPAAVGGRRGRRAGGAPVVPRRATARTVRPARRRGGRLGRRVARAGRQRRRPAGRRLRRRRRMSRSRRRPRRTRRRRTRRRSSATRTSATDPRSRPPPRRDRPPRTRRRSDASPNAGRAPSSRSARPTGQASPPPDSTEARAPPPKSPQDPAELFGPAWEAPRRYEAYPSLRTRVGLPSFGGISRIGVAAVAAGPRGRRAVLHRPDAARHRQRATRAAAARRRRPSRPRS